jgi:metal-sulfur cluster biosynthetic enzyme
MTATALGVVNDVLSRVVDPCSIATGAPVNLIEMGLVKSVRDEDGGIVVELRLTSPFCFQVGNIVDRIVELANREGVPRIRVDIDLRDEWLPSQMAPEAQARLRRIRPFNEAA